MTSSEEWNPRASETLDDPTSVYDHMRRKCPVAYSEYLQYSVFRHADVVHILHDHQNFSSQASQHVSVPNSMDPPEHTAWRKLIDPYFSAARMEEFRPVCQAICDDIVDRLPRNSQVEIMGNVAEPFALRLQCAFMGWPEQTHQPLLQWLHKKNRATLAGDIQANAAVAREFDATIRGLLQERRQRGNSNNDDVTGRLMNETINGRPISEDEIVSILRNWTVGELGTMAASIGIIAAYLAKHPDVQQLLRNQDALIEQASDEILRMHAPLIANRRCPTKDVTIGGRLIKKGSRITVMWASANRDEAVFGDPDEFRLDRNPADNLLYGAGVHVCPGAPLARMEIASMIRSLLAATGWLKMDASRPPVPARYPASGYHKLYLLLEGKPARSKADAHLA